MIKKIIFLCVRYRIRIFSKLFHTLALLGDIVKSWFNLSKRSPVLFNWATSYVQYIQSPEWIKSLHEWLSDKDKIFIDGILEKILYIAYHNIVDYRKLYSDADEIEQQKYLKYFYAQPNTNYFKKNGYWLVNEYCIARDVKELAIAVDGKDIIDCGAYIGDSGISFSDHFPNSKVYAMEPDKKNFEQLKEVIQLYTKESKIMPINVGVGEKDTEGFLSDEGIGSKLSDSGTKIQIRSIDSIVKEYNLKPGLIKRDIEWFEYYSILGTLETLKSHKPILLISVYHQGRDLFEVKKLIQELNIGYQFTFTRRDSMTAFSDTLLVCY